jgi:outer membrane protein OmpA-like peptidoglycan-associated protein
MKITRIAQISNAILILSMVFGLAQYSEAGVGKLWPFATKKHVKNQIDPLSGRVGELEEVNKDHAKRIKEIDDRTQAGINAAMQGVQEADSKASKAQEGATAAGNAAQEASNHINRFQQDVDSRLGNVDNYQQVKTAQVNFGVSQTVLNQESKAALDELAKEMGESKGYVLEVEGFADPRGSEAQNLQLSKERACSVVRYLVEAHQIPLFRIRTLGLGDANAVKKETGRVDYSKSRRVEIHLLRNDTLQVASKEGGL